LTNKILVSIAQNVINIPYEDINIKSKNNINYKISKEYCVEHGTTPNRYKNIVRKYINYQKIGNLYDLSKSVKDNLLILSDNGVKTSLNTLYRFCKENQIPTNPSNVSQQKSFVIQNNKKEKERTLLIWMTKVTDEEFERQKSKVRYIKQIVERMRQSA